MANVPTPANHNGVGFGLERFDLLCGYRAIQPPWCIQVSRTSLRTVNGASAPIADIAIEPET